MRISTGSKIAIFLRFLNLSGSEIAFFLRFLNHNREYTEERRILRIQTVGGRSPNPSGGRPILFSVCYQLLFDLTNPL